MKNTGENTGESIKTELKEDKRRKATQLEETEGGGKGGFKGTWSCCHGWSCQCSICRRVLCCRRCLVARICTSHSTSRKPLRTRWALSVGCTCPCTTLRNLWTPNQIKSNIQLSDVVSVKTKGKEGIPTYVLHQPSVSTSHDHLKTTYTPHPSRYTTTKNVFQKQKK